MNKFLSAPRNDNPQPQAGLAVKGYSSEAGYWVDINKLLPQHTKSTELAWSEIIEDLDNLFPLNKGSHADVCEYVVYYHQLLAFFKDGSSSGLRSPGQLVGFTGSKEKPTSVLLKEGGRHIELELDSKHRHEGCALSNMQVETTADLADLDTSIDMPTLAPLLKHQLKGNPLPCERDSAHCKVFRTADGEEYQTHNCQWI